jgi:2-oxoisovalerate dehydrogenase E2 component (dihydrolipoyl transacylase)
VEEFSPLCEVQSDKASVDITSRFAGVVKKLHYEAGEMAKVGKPFVDIDIQGDAKEEDLAKLTTPEPEPVAPTPTAMERSMPDIAEAPQEVTVQDKKPVPTPVTQQTGQPLPQQTGKHASLATPATRHLSKEFNVDICQVPGTGKEGRVTKEDIYKFVERQKAASSTAQQQQQPPTFHVPPTSTQQTETRSSLTKTQEMMFKTMTRSLNIPHFLYADEIDFTQLVELRRRLNSVLAKSPASPQQGGVIKLSYLPFLIKAVSMALHHYPILNARVDFDPTTNKPHLTYRSQHNIGIAMDTPAGLLVPVIKDVANLNILSIAAELARLQALANAGKLGPTDMSGGTITVSNIGNIGGTYLSPVVVEKEVAILGVGRMRVVPAFDDAGNVVRKSVCNFSWSADHRVVDGATLARAAEGVRGLVEEPDVMVMHLR